MQAAFQHRQPASAAEEQAMLDLALALSQAEVQEANDVPVEHSAPILTRSTSLSAATSLPRVRTGGDEPSIPDTSDDAALAQALHDAELAAAAKSDATPPVRTERTGNPPTVCAGCGKPLAPSGIIGFFGATEYMVLPHDPGRAYHVGCLECNACGKALTPRDQVAIEDSKVYHAKCLMRQRRPTCNCCHEKIPSDPPGSGHVRYMNNSFWKERYCVRHQHDASVVSCTSCLRLRVRDSDEVVHLADGRVACLSCFSLALHRTVDAQALYASVLEWYRSIKMPHKEQPPFSLVENTALNDARGKDGPPAAAPITHTRGLCLVEQWDILHRGAAPQRHVAVNAILVLSGLPLLLTGAVLAHELMHAWLRMEGFQSLPPAVEEGLCQLMAYLWLEAQTPEPGSEAERIAAYVGHSIRTDSSDVYGDGFRRALRAFQEVGELPAILGHIRTERDFPFSSFRNALQRGAQD